MMASMRLDGIRLRASALLGVGALAVHELRYLVGYGGETGRMLAAHGHSYLALATTLAVLLFLVALAGFLARVARGGGDGRRPRGRAGWRRPRRGPCSRSTLFRSCLRGLSPRDIPAASPACSATAAGLPCYSPPPLASL